MARGRLVLFDSPPGLADVGAIYWSWVGMPAWQVAEQIPPPTHPDEPALPRPRPRETKGWIAWGSDGPPADPRFPPPLEDVVAIAVGYSGEGTEPPPELVQAHERRYQEILAEQGGGPDDPAPSEEELQRLDAIMDTLVAAGWDAMMTIRKPKTGRAYFEPAVTMLGGEVRRIKTIEAAQALGTAK